jgi:hypothetical protein
MWDRDVARLIAGTVGRQACAEASGTLENLIESLEDGADDDDARLRDLASVARLLRIAAGTDGGLNPATVTPSDVEGLETVAPIMHVCTECARRIRRGTPWATFDDDDEGLTVWAVDTSIPPQYSTDPCDWCADTVDAGDRTRFIAYATSRVYPVHLNGEIAR